MNGERFEAARFRGLDRVGEVPAEPAARLSWDALMRYARSIPPLGAVRNDWADELFARREMLERENARATRIEVRVRDL